MYFCRLDKSVNRVKSIYGLLGSEDFGFQSVMAHSSRLAPHLSEDGRWGNSGF